MRIALEAEVESFLSEVFSILNKFPKGLYIPRRTNSEDKTLNFQNKTGLTHHLIREELLSLDISNYSYTDREEISIDMESYGFSESCLILRLLMKLRRYI